MMHYVRQMGFTLFGASHLAILCSVPRRIETATSPFELALSQEWCCRTSVLCIKLTINSLCVQD